MNGTGHVKRKKGVFSSRGLIMLVVKEGKLFMVPMSPSFEFVEGQEQEPVSCLELLVLALFSERSSKTTFCANRAKRNFIYTITKVCNAPNAYLSTHLSLSSHFPHKLAHTHTHIYLLSIYLILRVGEGL